MITFDELTIEGFGSIITPITVKFKKKGLVLVRGKNGAGKTTIFSALAWCVYGTTLKKKPTVNTWVFMQPKDYAGTMVSLKFRTDDHKFQVIRCSDYKKKIEGVMGKDRILIYKDGVLEPEAKLRQANPYIQKIMGMSFDLFRMSIVFGQKMKRLIDESGPDKKKILEEAFEIGYIDKAKGLAEKKLGQARIEHSKANAAATETLASIDAKEEEIIRLEKLQANWEKERNEKVEELLTKSAEYSGKVDQVVLAELTEQLENLEETIPRMQKKLKGTVTPDLNTLNRKLLVAKSSRDKLKNQIKDAEERIKDYENDRCAYCGAPIKPEEAELRIAEHQQDINGWKLQLKDINKAILGHKKDVSSAELAITKLDTLKNKFNKKLESFRDISDKIKEYRGYMDRAKEYMDDAEKESARVPNFNIAEVQEEIKELKVTLEDQEILRDKWKRKVNIYSWMITTPLSNSGMKAFMFNQMLQRVNKKLASYAHKIGFKPELVIDMVSARKDINIVVYKGKYPVPFDDLSGGQQQLVNIIMAFAVHDVVAEDVFNLFVMDEVFESLDAENVEIVSYLIGEKAINKCIYLITHLKDFIPMGSQTLEIINNSGATEVLLG